LLVYKLAYPLPQVLIFHLGSHLLLGGSLRLSISVTVDHSEEKPGAQPSLYRGSGEEARSTPLRQCLESC
ncbi:MAG: hypothetical protein ACRDKZ_03590, partial [Actinomycetota bacterium]